LEVPDGTVFKATLRLVIVSTFLPLAATGSAEDEAAT
jgi:hypothetical protein